MKNKVLIICIIILSVIPYLLVGDSELKSYIQQVENSLNPSVVIEGVTQWTLKERMANYGVPGVSIAVIDDYKIHWAKGYGVANKKTGQPVTESTLFQAASISKPVTAVVALKLVQEGILTLDTNVNTQLKSWKIPENKYSQHQKVTLRRLLSHSAGLTVHGFRGYGKGEKVPTILEVLDGKSPSNSKPVRIDKEPGSGFRYSGGGYTVLQLLIEDVTGGSLSSLTQKYILNPLGMKHSSFQKPLPESLIGSRSFPHTQKGEPLEPHWFLKSGSGCCGLWTTPTDLARFAIEIQQLISGEMNRILTPQMGRAMLTPTNSEIMGLGFRLTHRGDETYFQHSGGNPPGFSCLLFAHRDKGYGVAVMTNASRGGLLCREVIQAVAHTYQWDGYEIDRYKSFAQIIETYRKLNKKNPEDHRISENRLNSLGYTILSGRNPEEALKIFKLNCDFYPNSANCYDSLGDAYLALKDHKNALASFRKALQVLSEFPVKNKNHQQLRQLTGDKIKKLQQDNR